ERGLGDPEARSFPAEEVGDRHPHVLKLDLAMPLRRMMVHDGDVADDAEPGRILWHDDEGVAGVAGSLRRLVGDTHDDDEGEIRMLGAGGEPFAPVDDIMVAVAPDG